MYVTGLTILAVFKCTDQRREVRSRYSAASATIHRTFPPVMVSQRTAFPSPSQRGGSVFTLFLPSSQSLRSLHLLSPEIQKGPAVPELLPGETASKQGPNRSFASD